MKKMSIGNCIPRLLCAAALVLALLILLPGRSAQAAGTYVKVNGAGVNFRKGASLSSETWCTLKDGWVLSYTGSQADEDGNTWYAVNGNIPGQLYRTYAGYIRADFVTFLTAAEAAAWEKNPVQTGTTPSPKPTGSGTYAILIADAVNLRQYAPGGPVLTTVKLGSVVKVISGPTSSYGWYYIVYGNYTGYIYQDFARYLTTQEMEKYGLVTAAPTAVVVTLEPTTAPSGSTYCKVAKDSVRFRETPNGTVITTLAKNTLMIYRGTQTLGNDGYYWINVQYNGQWGYIRKDMLTMINNGGTVTATPTTAPVITATPTSSSSSGIYVITTAGGLNYRKTAGGDVLGRLSKGTILPFYGWDSTGKWAMVYYAAWGYGYVSKEYVRSCDAKGNTTTATPVPVVTATPAPFSNGYVITQKSNVYLRSGPSTSSTPLTTLSANAVCEMIGAAVTSGGYTWYPVARNGMTGYLRSDVAYRLSDWQASYYEQYGTVPTASPVPKTTTTPTGNSTYIRITATGTINVRSSATTASNRVGTASPGAVYQYTATTKAGSYTWYKIVYASNKLGWVRGDLLKVMTWQEYYAWAGTTTATPTPGGQTGTPSSVTTPSATSPYSTDLSDTGITKVDGLNVRSGAGTSNTRVGYISSKNSRVTYLQQTKLDASGNSWYYIEYGNVRGWVMAKYVTIYTNRQLTAYLQTGDYNATPEASYTTLSLGSTGNAVVVLQKELVKLGYLTSADVTGNYLSSTVAAVKSFQSKKGLSVDGIAGDATQHALFNTVPTGSSGGSTVIPDLQPVELVDWYTGDIQNVWLKGEVAIVTDVTTGLSFRARRWSGGNHADVEPLTAADTAVMCRIYGVTVAQDIMDLNMYQRRPLWVTIDGRTFAASMYGCPHNYPDGDTIDDNDFYGQFCIHFVNSKTHGSAANPAHVDSDHQNAIKYAYQNSISGKK